MQFSGQSPCDIFTLLQSIRNVIYRGCSSDSIGGGGTNQLFGGLSQVLWSWSQFKDSFMLSSDHDIRRFEVLVKNLHLCITVASRDMCP